MFLEVEVTGDVLFVVDGYGWWFLGNGLPLKVYGWWFMVDG